MHNDRSPISPTTPIERGHDTALAKANRKPDTGLIRPQRPKPDDFRQVYLILGWGGVCEHYRTNWRVIRRWIEEEGREGLKVERDEIVARFGRATRYVLGQRMGQRTKAVRGKGK